MIAKLLLGTLCAVGALFAAADASAQKMSVTVPFTFQANHVALPAGFYQVKMLSSRLVEFYNTTTKETHVLMIHPVEESIHEAPGRLSFVRVGQQYHLNRVSIAGKSTHGDLVIQHKADAELAKELMPESVTADVMLE